MADQTSGVPAPPVRLELCAAFRVDDACAWPICDACGWLEDDHPIVDADAVVTEFPRRRGVEMPERKAS